MPANHLLSFYGSVERDSGYAERQEHLHWSAARFGNIQEQHPWNLGELKQTKFYQQHKAVLDCERGAGFWLWKPYLMLKLMKEIPQGDFLFYHDVGRAFRRNPNIGYQFDRSIDPLVDWAKQNNGMFPGIYIPVYGPSSRWTKRDCFVLTESDQEEYWSQPQVQAGINVWQNTSSVRDFIAEWLQYCEDPRILTDQENQCGKPNFSDFLDHRHDQSVLTILLRKHGVSAYGNPQENLFKHREISYITAKVTSDIAAETNKHANKPPLESLLESRSPARLQRGAAPLYRLLMEHKRDQALSILEIRDQLNNESELWPQYLPKAAVHTLTAGTAKEGNQEPDKSNITHHSIDPSHRPSMEIFALRMKKQNVQFDFIIECGSGLMHDQQLAIGTLFELLKPGGVFITEQLENSIRPEVGDLKPSRSNSTAELIKRINLPPFKINSHYFSLAEARKMPELMQTAGTYWFEGYGISVIRRWHDNDPEREKLKKGSP